MEGAQRERTVSTEWQRDRMNRKSPCQSTFGSFLKKDLRAPYWEGKERMVN